MSVTRNWTLHSYSIGNHLQRSLLICNIKYHFMLISSKKNVSPTFIDRKRDRKFIRCFLRWKIPEGSAAMLARILTDCIPPPGEMCDVEVIDLLFLATQYTSGQAGLAQADYVQLTCADEQIKLHVVTRVHNTHLNVMAWTISLVSSMPLSSFLI